MDLQLKGKRAMVTGASSGLGEAISQMLASEGAEVIVHGRNADRAQQVANEIREAGGLAEVALGDLATGADAGYLTSPLADYISGAIIRVDGGIMRSL